MSFLSMDLLTFLVLALAEILAQGSWIAVMRRERVAQVQKAYGPGVDADVKAQVPSLGGAVFMLVGSGFLVGALISRHWQAVALWTYPILVGAVGLVDDLMKFRRHSSEGFSSKGKFAVQMAVTVIWFAQLIALGLSPLPEIMTLQTAGWWLLLLFFAIGTQNAVNVTDGLDGLAAGAALISFLALWVMLDGAPVTSTAALTGAAICAGFLWHNGHPALVFMGDGGAHFLAGLLVSTVFLSKLTVFALIPLGFLFGVEMLSVVIQLIAIHGFGRRVFRMSPLHHHFQLMGWPETRITWRFLVVHLLGLTGCVWAATVLL